MLLKNATLLGRRKGRGGEILAFGGPGQVFGGEGGAFWGRMRREGRCCPFKRRWRSRDLFSFPGRRAEPRLGAQGGEVRSWAWKGGARAGAPLLPPSLRSTGLPAQPEPPPSQDRRRQCSQGGAAGTSCEAWCPGRGRGDPTRGWRENRSADLGGESESADLERT